MQTKQIVKRLLLGILLVGFSYALYYCWGGFQVISGYNAKIACSCSFLQGREKENIQKEELASFPLSLAKLQIDKSDSSVTATVFGLAKRKAIYRHGFGCTLVNEVPEEILRNQKFQLPVDTHAASGTWPTGDAPHHVVPSFDSAKLAGAVSFLFNPQRGKEIFTRAVVIVFKDAIVAEKYAKGYHQNSMLLGWSMAKSITGALTGILVGEGRLTITSPAPVNEWKDKKDGRQYITTEHLLQQTSGLDFWENYVNASDATKMLFNKADMGRYTVNRPLKHPPGSRFYYSSGNSNVLSLIIRNVVGQPYYHPFPYKHLFHKTGMYHTLFEPDASGTFVGSSYIYASARDYARFGLLYLHDGVWNGERILPEGWVKKTMTPAAAPLKNYGYQFWLNGVDEKDPSKREFPEAPADMFYADGYGGQRIYIIPSRQLVAVRLGVHKFDEHEFLKRLIAAFP